MFAGVGKGSLKTGKGFGFAEIRFVCFQAAFEFV
jgi:hypothetical protein